MAGAARARGLAPGRGQSRWTGEFSASTSGENSLSSYIVARDRAGGYAGAIAAAAPMAVQVADRWHLMENASATFLQAVRSEMGPIRRALGAGVIDPDLLSAAERLQHDGYLRRREENSDRVARVSGQDASTATRVWEVVSLVMV